jgi:hypothetical protein
MHFLLPAPSAVYSSSVCCFLFIYLFILPGGYAGLSQGWLGEYHVMLGTHLFGLPNVSQAGLELVSAGTGSPPVFSE